MNLRTRQRVLTVTAGLGLYVGVWGSLIDRVGVMVPLGIALGLGALLSFASREVKVQLQ